MGPVGNGGAGLLVARKICFLASLAKAVPAIQRPPPFLLLSAGVLGRSFRIPLPESARRRRQGRQCCGCFNIIPPAMFLTFTVLRAGVVNQSSVVGHLEEYVTRLVMLCLCPGVMGGDS